MSTKDYLSGKETQAYEFLGCHKKNNNDYIFRVFAPNASEVYLVGDFNDWQKEKMRSYSNSLFSLSNKKAKPNDNYLYIVKTNNGEFKKLDSYSRLLNIDYELSSVVYDDSYKFKSKTKIEKNNIILEQEVATNIAYNMLMNNKNKEYISAMSPRLGNAG